MVACTRITATGAGIIGTATGMAVAAAASADVADKVLCRSLRTATARVSTSDLVHEDQVAFRFPFAKFQTLARLAFFAAPA